jgi:Tfp pilus assembly protein PilO
VAVLETENSDLRQSLNTEQANLNKHKALDGIIKPVKFAHEYLGHLFTNEDEVDALLRIIAELGAQAGINFNTPAYAFKNKTVISPLYAEVQFTLDIDAPYLNFLKFLYSVSNYSRLINITSVSLGAPTVTDNRQVMLKIKCQGSTYRVLTPEELKQVSQPKK